MPILPDLLRPNSQVSTPGEALAASVAHLRSLAKRSSAALGKLSIRTIGELARSAFLSRVVDMLATAECSKDKAARVPADWVTKNYRETPLAKFQDLPVIALRAVEPRLNAATAKALGTERVGDLGSWPPFLAARQILELASQEPEPGAPRHVEATVRSVAGDFVENAILRALHVGLCDEIELGRSEPTDEDGRASLTYRAEGRVDLQVEVQALVNGDIWQRIGRSELVMNAADKLSLDIVVGEGIARPLPQYDQIERRLRKVIRRECPQLSLAGLSLEQQRLLAGKTELPEKQVKAYVEATREAARADVDPSLLFALGQAGHPVQLAAFAAVSQTRLKGDVLKAVERGVIRHQLVADLDTRLEHLGDRAAREAVQPLSNGRAEPQVLRSPEGWGRFSDDAQARIQAAVRPQAWAHDRGVELPPSSAPRVSAGRWDPRCGHEADYYLPQV